VHAVTLVTAALLLAAGAASAADHPLAPTGTLRAAYLAGNPVQVVRDSSTGEITGIAVELARELARRFDVPLVMAGAESVQEVFDAVREHRADIGFLENDASRPGPVEFTRTYLRNPQSFAVPRDSPIRSFADIDRPGVRIGVTRMVTIGPYLRRTLKSATLTEVDGTNFSPVRELFHQRMIDAFGADRLRLTRIVAEVPGLRMLSGSLYGVPQAIAVPAGKPERLALLNGFLDEVRRNGFLQAAIDRSNNGTEIEPALK